MRVASAALGCPVEFVILEGHRALIVAGAGPEAIKPRPHHAAEREILAGSPVAVAPSGTAAFVNLGTTDRPGALFAAAALDTSGVAVLSGVASMLAGNLCPGDGAARIGLDSELALAAEVEEQQRELVRETLDDDRLVMYFQPIVDANNRPVALEALARIQTKTGEIVSPAGFIDAIEGTDLMVSLDSRAFQLSCRAAATLARGVPYPLYVACNFSAKTIAQPNLSKNVLDMIAYFDLSPDQLCIEVTETAVSEAGAHELSELHRAGVRIALDNFGTGYCELSTLRDLPLSSVKIDKSFTAALDKSGTEQAIAATVLELAKSLELTVVAEGVENSRQWRSARSVGIETMQGWFYSPAIPFDEVVSLLLGVQVERTPAGSPA